MNFLRLTPELLPHLNFYEIPGLGYLSLGQPSTTLSGGEAQRIKLVAEIRKGQGRAEVGNHEGQD